MEVWDIYRRCFKKYSIYAGAPIIFKEKSPEITLDVPNIDTLIINLSNKNSELVKLNHIKNGAWFIYYVNMKKIDGIYFVGMIPASLALIGWFWIASKLWV